MMTFVEFRNALKKFLLEYGEDVLGDFENAEMKRKAKAQMDEWMICINRIDAQLYGCMSGSILPLRVTPADLAPQIANQGILVRYLI